MIVAGDATGVKIDDLDAGTWYFSVRGVDTNELKSEFPEIVEHTIE